MTLIRYYDESRCFVMESEKDIDIDEIDFFWPDPVKDSTTTVAYMLDGKTMHKLDIVYNEECPHNQVVLEELTECE